MAELFDRISTWLDPRFVGEIAATWSGRLLGALAIFLVGRLFLRALTRWATLAMRRVGLDDTLNRFLGNLLYTVVLVFLVLTAFSTLGVPTLNFLAIVGAAGLAVGLALKDSLSNFSSGVMLVFFRPFKVGDHIDAAGVSGVVDAIGIFDVVLKTPDNRVINVPNSIIGAVVAAEPRVAKYPAPEVAVQDVLPTLVTIAVRAWAASGDYGNVRSDLLERIKRALDKYGLGVPAEQRALPAAMLASNK